MVSYGSYIGRIYADDVLKSILRHPCPSVPELQATLRVP